MAATSEYNPVLQQPEHIMRAPPFTSFIQPMSQYLAASAGPAATMDLTVT